MSRKNAYEVGKSEAGTRKDRVRRYDSTCSKTLFPEPIKTGSAMKV